MDKRITRAQLEMMYNERQINEVCDALDVTISGLYKMLDSAEIPRKQPGMANRRKRTTYEIVE